MIKFRKFGDYIKFRQKLTGKEGPYALHTFASANAVGILGEKNEFITDSIVNPELDRVLFLMQLRFNNTRTVMYIIYDMSNEEWTPISSVVQKIDDSIAKEWKIISSKAEEKVKLNHHDKAILKFAAELYIKKFS